MTKNSKDLLGLKYLSTDDIMEIMKSAETMKYVVSQSNKKVPHLLGKSIIEVFYEPSMRTRLSFELAAQYMSGTISALSMPANYERETLLDVANTVDHMGANIIVLRHPLSGAAELVAKNVSASVINAGDGTNEQPTQALVDIFTILQKKGHIEGIKVAMIGDITDSRIAKSNIYGLTKLGAVVSVGGPATLIPAGLDKIGVSVYPTIQETLLDADVVMCFRIKGEDDANKRRINRGEYGRFFGMNKNKLQLIKKDAMIMHSIPVKRGVEVTSDVICCERSVIEDQITNGVAVNMAVMYLYSKRGGVVSGENFDQQGKSDRS